MQRVSISHRGAKAAAFNFFVNGITGYGKENNAPKLAFVFKTGDDGVSADRRFVVISGYAKAEGETAGRRIWKPARAVT